MPLLLLPRMQRGAAGGAAARIAAAADSACIAGAASGIAVAAATGALDRYGRTESPPGSSHTAAAQQQAVHQPVEQLGQAAGLWMHTRPPVGLCPEAADWLGRAAGGGRST